MTPTKSRTLTVTPRRLACAALSALALGLSACGNAEDGEHIITKARADLETLAATNHEGLTPKVTYDKIISDLNKVADSSAPGQAAAARILRSRAYLRQGDQAADTVAEIERRSRMHAESIRNFHNQWLDLHAQAEALKKFDASKGMAEIDAEVKAKVAEIDEARRALAQAEQELKTLQDKAAAAQEQAKAQSDKELEFRSQMIDKTEVQRAELVRQANEARRAGDRFALEAADYLAQAGRQRPMIAELQLRVERLEAQKQMLEESRAQLKAAEETARKQAERALMGQGEDIGARQVGENLAAAMKELAELRAGLEDPTDQAQRLYGQALGEVQKAKSGAGAGRGAGAETALPEAAIHHAHADLLLMRARGLEAQAALYTLLAETKPPLSGAEEYRTKAKSTSEAAAEMLGQAKEKFGQARELYERAGSAVKAQEVKDRLEQIARALAVYAPSEGGEGAVETEPMDETDVVAADQPGDQPTDAPAPEAAPLEGAEAEVMALLQKASSSMKDATPEEFMSLLVFRNTEQEEIFKKLMPAMIASAQLNEACREHFGDDFEDVVKKEVGAGMAAGMGQFDDPGKRAMSKLEDLDPADVQISVLPGGSDAEVRFKSAEPGTMLECMKLEGEWRIKMDFEYPPMMKAVLTDDAISKMTKIIETMTANVKAGKYGKDPKKLLQDYQMELMKMAPGANDDDGGK